MRLEYYDFDPIRLQKCVFVGGSGVAIEPGEEIELLFEPGKLLLMQEGAQPEILLYPEMIELRISGPGTVTTGAGFMGGGFGVESALQGIAVATVLNLLTTRSKTHTYVTVSSLRGDLHFHYSGMEPAALAITLSPVLTSLRRLDQGWIQSQLERLESCKQVGVITEEELARMRQTLIAPPSRSELASQIAVRKQAQSEAMKRKAEQARQEETARRRELQNSAIPSTPGKQVDITFFGKKL